MPDSTKGEYNIKMEYEILKKLKDSGFPQTGKGTYTTPVGPTSEYKLYQMVDPDNYVYMPTLEELAKEWLKIKNG